MTTYHWDAQNQLIGIDFPNGTSAVYAYDALGRRIEKDVDGTVTRYIYDAEDIFLEYDYDGVLTSTLTVRYGHGDRIDQPLAVERVVSGEEYFYHADHLGSIRALTDDMGSVVNEYVYDAFGRLLSIAEAVPQPYAFTGREYDAESALYYYRARHYDSRVGRFLTIDPLGFEGGSWNIYQYISNNPSNGIDPFGLGEVVPGPKGPRPRPYWMQPPKPGGADIIPLRRPTPPASPFFPGECFPFVVPIPAICAAFPGQYPNLCPPHPDLFACGDAKRGPTSS